MTAAGQDGERLVTAVKARVRDRCRDDPKSIKNITELYVSAVLAELAVAPDLDRAGYDRARRDCADELRAALRVARLRHRNGRTAGMMLAPFEFLAAEWSPSGRAPAGEEEQR